MAEYLYYAFLVFYLPFFIVCFVTTIITWVAEWKYDGIKNWGACMLLIAAFVPIVNIKMSLELFPQAMDRLIRLFRAP